MATAEVNRVLRLKPCRQDRQLAFQILGFGASNDNQTPDLPSVSDFIEHTNDIFHRISPFQFDHLPTGYAQNLAKYRAGTAVKKVLNAVFTVGDFFCESWPDFWDEEHVFQISALDRPVDAPAWESLDGPMALRDYQNHVNSLGVPGKKKDEENISIQRLTGPTQSEVNAATSQRTNDFPNDPYVVHITVDDPESGWAEIMANGVQSTIEIRPVMGDGNCFWYAVSQSLFGDWTRFGEVKSNICKYFTDVLNDPQHNRYRTYCILDRNSRKNSSSGLGEYSIQRSLHNNDHGRKPMWRPENRLGFNQVIADFYHAEVIEFCDPKEWGPEIDMLEVGQLRSQHPMSEDGAYYVARVRGSADADRQILIFNSGDHFSSGHLPMEFIFNHGGAFPTQNVQDEERWEVMPWYEVDANEKIRCIHREHLPRPLQPENTYNAPPNHLASTSDQQYVLAGRNYPAWHYGQEIRKAICLPPDEEMLAWTSPLEPSSPPNPLRQINYQPFDACNGPDVNGKPPFVDWVVKRGRRGNDRPSKPLKPGAKMRRKKRDGAYRHRVKKAGTAGVPSTARRYDMRAR